MKNKNIKAPLLLRLLDDQPHLLFEKKVMNTVSVINARSSGVIWDEKFSGLNHSILNYGVSDFAHSYFGNKTSQKQLCSQMQEMIERLETRLCNVQVDLLDSDIAMNRILKLRISANINLEPMPIPAVFESCWDIIRQKFSIEE